MSSPRQPRHAGHLMPWVLGAAIAFAAIGTGTTPARSATVSCPRAPLLSEEVSRAGSVFIGTVRGPADDPEAPIEGAPDAFVSVVVEEVWRGPDLAAIVDVSNPHYAGAPRIVLATGGRYLFLGEPGGLPGSDEPVTRVDLRECSLTRLISPDFAELRPPNARVMAPFVPTHTGSSGGPTTWPWVLAGLFGLAAGGALLLRDRLTRAAWLPWATAGAALTAIGIGAALAVLQPATGTATASPTLTPTPGPAGESPAAPGPEDPTLVVRLTDGSAVSGSSLRLVSVHADGRVVSTASTGQLVQRRLSPAGIEQLRLTAEATGLLGPGAPATAAYRAVPLADGPDSGDLLTARLIAGHDAVPIVIEWTPIPTGDLDRWEPSAEIAALDALAERLWDLEGWLPPAAWLDPHPIPYAASRFRLSDEELVAAQRPVVALGDVRWPLTPPLDELPQVRTPAGVLTRCLSLTRGEATEVVGALSAALDDSSLGLAAPLVVALAGSGAAEVHWLAMQPLMPDELGCPTSVAVQEVPTLAPGVAALIRVDGLRMRDGPGAEFSATHVLQAGERVVVVTDATASDGTTWWLVRQGPGEREGWVSAAPPGEDPWLVPIANGRIALLHGAGEIRTMGPDGTDLATLADAAAASWSPDGRRVLLAVPPAAGQSEWEIAVAEADGSSQRTVAVGDAAVWSPDGTRVAFVRSGEGRMSVYLIGVDGTGLERVADGSRPAWSPDGSALLVWQFDPTVERPSGDGFFPIPEALWSVDLGSGEARQLTPFEVGAPPMAPAWSPDGQLIALDDRVIDATGTVVVRLDEGDVLADRPWSPDGEDLIVLDSTDEGVAIGLLGVDTGTMRTIVPAGTTLPSQVIWSPDGRFLAYAAVRISADGDLASLRTMIVSASGGDPLAIGAEDSQFPVWQPIVSHPLD